MVIERSFSIGRGGPGEIERAQPGRAHGRAYQLHHIGIVALGADLVPGFDLLADELHLPERVEAADIVITGEGFLDEQSFEGKVVGGMSGLAERSGTKIVAIAGDVYDDAASRIESVSLVDWFGEARAMTATLECVDEVVTAILSGAGRPG